MDGTNLELPVESESNVWTLKEQLSNVSGVPPVCQQLLVSGAELLNQEQIATHTAHETAILAVTVIVSMDRLLEMLSSRSELDWTAAVRTLTDKSINPRIVEATIPTLVASLRVPDATMCMKALEALSDLSVTRDERVITAVAAHLGNRSAYVRKAARETLAKVVDRCDEIVLHATIDFLSQPCYGIRYEAVRALAAIVKNGDDHAITPLAARLADSDKLIRQAAWDALATLNGQHTSPALAMLLVMTETLLGDGNRGKEAERNKLVENFLKERKANAPPKSRATPKADVLYTRENRLRALRKKLAQIDMLERRSGIYTLEELQKIDSKPSIETEIAGLSRA